MASQRSRPGNADRAGRDPDDPRGLLFNCFRAALAAVDGRGCVRRELEHQRLAGPWSVLGVGKAAAAMALGAAEALGDRVAGGLVIVPPGHVPPEFARDSAAIRVIESSHPLPDARSLAAGRALVEWVAQLPGDAQVLCLVSGGASSLVEALRPGLAFDDLQCVTRWGLESGAAISALNAVRSRLSLLKGGGLARLLGARRAVALMISDVPGDDPAVIGSGLLHVAPHAAGSTEGAALPRDVAAIVRRAGAPGAERTPRVPVTLVATITTACQAAARHAQSVGMQVEQATRRFDGDAQQRGEEFARHLISATGPVLLVSGGESTVRLPATPGRGGRNQHLALAAAVELERSAACNAWLLAAGTDGIDGRTADAGAIVDAGTCDRGRDAGYDPHVSLALADSGTFLEGAGDLLHTGPTLTNVGDLVLALRR